MKKKLEAYKQLLEFLLSGGIFVSLLLWGNFIPEYNFPNMVYVLLGYVVILELVRMVGEYIFENHIKIRSIIDTFIVFSLREIVLNYSDKHIAIEQKAMIIFIGLMFVFSLFYFRKRAMEESPNETNCQKCVANKNCLSKTPESELQAPEVESETPLKKQSLIKFW